MSLNLPDLTLCDFFSKKKLLLCGKRLESTEAIKENLLKAIPSSSPYEKCFEE